MSKKTNTSDSAPSHSGTPEALPSTTARPARVKRRVAVNHELRRARLAVALALPPPGGRRRPAANVLHLLDLLLKRNTPNPNTHDRLKGSAEGEHTLQNTKNLETSDNQKARRRTHYNWSHRWRIGARRLARLANPQKNLKPRRNPPTPNTQPELLGSLVSWQTPCTGYANRRGRGRPSKRRTKPKKNPL